VAQTKGEKMIFPSVILVDDREKLPYSFLCIKADKKDGGGVIQIATQRTHLQTGDYSLLGHESRISVEKKSLSDLYSTLGQGRDRFVRELERMAEIPHAHVVVEAEWSTILNNPPPRSSLNPKTVYRSVLAWVARYPSVHWWTMPDRAHAEVTTFRILERYLKELERE
jgi:DNA excision repair protein ERCC-4